MNICIYSCSTISHSGKRNIRSEAQSTMQLLQGIWQSEEDSLAGLRIENNTLFFTHKNFQESSEATYILSLKSTLPQFVNPTQKAEFLVLTSRSDTLYYEILGLTDKILSLEYYPATIRTLYIRQ